jgi:hypothetical protein
MKLKSYENNLIWENYGRPNVNTGDLYSDEEAMSDEDAEMVMHLAPPMGEVEPEFGDEDDLGGEEDFDDILEDDDIEDDEVDNEIILHSLRKLVKRSEQLLDLCKSKELETWQIAKIIKAEDYISDVWDCLDDDADFANDGFEDSEF